jgi:7,8-dihydropterin-6-yl-methyl-4-(beta-D-ribofuranosyl)aminobenzene 5'-phosphate synthase
MVMMIRNAFAWLLVLLAWQSMAQDKPRKQVQSATITVLSTMLADRGFGEWGFAALVEADGHTILFDTGAAPDTVLRNARLLGVDLSKVTEVILSHNHADHTGGLLALRQEAMKSNPSALSHAWVAKGIFYPRAGGTAVALGDSYRATGGSFTELDGPKELYPGVWLTGPVPRKYPERNFTMNGKAGEVTLPDGSKAEDNVPEDQSLVLDTARGLVVLSGCGHSGIVNTLDYARSCVRADRIYAALGGFHLFEADDKALEWTGRMLREFQVAQLLGAHCTGIEAVYRLRALTGLTRQTCVVGAVGATFTLKDGLSPGRIAR